MFEQMENLILANNLSTYLYILGLWAKPRQSHAERKILEQEQMREIESSVCSNSIENVLFIYLLF